MINKQTLLDIGFEQILNVPNETYTYGNSLFLVKFWEDFVPSEYHAYHDVNGFSTTMVEFFEKFIEVIQDDIRKYSYEC